MSIQRVPTLATYLKIEFFQARDYHQPYSYFYAKLILRQVTKVLRHSDVAESGCNRRTILAFEVPHHETRSPRIDPAICRTKLHDVSFHMDGILSGIVNNDISGKFTRF